MNWLLIHLHSDFQIAVAGVFIAQLFSLVYCAYKLPQLQLRPLIGLSFFAILYALLAGSATYDPDVHLTQIFQHCVISFGALVLYFYIKSLELFVRTESKIIKFASRYFLAMATLFFVGTVWLITTGQMFLYVVPKTPLTNVFLTDRMLQAAAPTPVLLLAMTSILVMQLGAATTFLRVMLRKQMDTILIVFVFLGCIIVLYEVCLALFIPKYSFSLLAFTGLLESGRLGYLTIRQYLGDRNQLIHNRQLLSIGELSVSIGHEINNCLAIGVATTDQLLHKYSDDKQVHRISQVFARMHRLMRAMRSVSQQPQEIQTWYEVGPAIDDVHALMKDYSNTRGVDVVLDTDQIAGLQFFGNSTIMQHMLLNIIKNGIEASQGKSGAEVKLLAYIKADDLKIDISDNGCGMAQKTQNHVYKPFFTTKNAQGGSGQGLAFVQREIYAIGGNITFTTSQNVGTTFSLTFPNRLIRIPK